MAELEVDIIPFNGDELIRLLNGLQEEIRKEVISDAFVEGAIVINQQAKQNLFASRKLKSKSGYSYYNSLFSVEELKRNIGVKYGVKHREGYKLRWVEWGTKERKTSTDQSRGNITATNFFYNAVAQKQGLAKQTISNSILKALEARANAKN